MTGILDDKTQRVSEFEPEFIHKLLFMLEPLRALYVRTAEGSLRIAEGSPLIVIGIEAHHPAPSQRYTD